MRVSQSTKFVFAPSMPIAKVGFPLPTSSLANSYREFNRNTFPRGAGSSRAAQRRRRETVAMPKPRRLSASGILGLLALIGLRMRYPFAESNIHPPIGILPIDLIS
jgi:hypothetical protein